MTRTMELVQEQRSTGDYSGAQKLLQTIVEEITGEALLPEAQSIRVLDACIPPHQLRQAIEYLSPMDESLHTLIRYFASKNPLEPVDLERLEWLATYTLSRLFQRRAPAEIEMIAEIGLWLEGGLPMAAPAASYPAPASVLELARIRGEIVACPCLQDLIASGLLSAGRHTKQMIARESLNAQVLAALVQYNLAVGERYQQLVAEVLDDLIPSAPDFQSKDYRAATDDLIAWNCQQRIKRQEAIQKAAALAKHNPDGKVSPRTESQKTGLKVDPMWEQTVLLTMISRLTEYVRAQVDETSTIPLSNSELIVTDLELRSLHAEYDPQEESYRADLNRVLKRGVGLRATIQEEIQFYTVRRDSEHLWKKHFDSLCYLRESCLAFLPELDRIMTASRSRGLHRKAEQIGQTLSGLREQLEKIRTIEEQRAPLESSLAAR